MQKVPSKSKSHFLTVTIVYSILKSLKCSEVFYIFSLPIKKLGTYIDFMKQILFSLIILLPVFSFAQEWKCFLEQDYYTTEATANLVIVPPQRWLGSTAEITLLGTNLPRINQMIPVKSSNKIAIGLAPLHDSTRIQVILQRGTQQLRGEVLLRKRPYRANAVKINRHTGSLIVDQLPYFPLGFYCYSPVQETLAEEEVHRGFNMISPYQEISAGNIAERKKYMDRCAALGMKVHYNLLSIAGGGGVGQSRNDYEASQKALLLRQEILAFKDHPALLGWYICDEPTGRQIRPEDLQYTYDLIKSIDPYHPVSIVFMNPKAASQYREVMDIVMADPYPIPNRSPDEVGRIIARLVDTFQYDIPVWLVPQAFGGGEHWAREPNPAEIRLMTWQGVLNGARGIQYFIRNGYNSFPKSSLTWDAASQACKEIKALTPFLLDYEEHLDLKVFDPSLEAHWYKRAGQNILVVLNTQNKPKNFQIQLPPQGLPDSLQVRYEDRRLPLLNGRIQDIIEGYGRRIYFFESRELKNVQPIYSQNTIIDPSFEQQQVPLTPAACYFKLRGDRGANAELDTRMAMHGQQSLRLQTSTYNEGLDVSLFPVQLRPGDAYAITFWARGGQGQEELSFRIGPYGREQRFQLSPYWRSYQWVFNARANEATRNDKTNIIFSLISQGKAWIDLVQISPEPRIDLVDNPFAQSTTVEINAAQATDPSISIHYTTDGTAPNITSIPYTGPLVVNRPMTLRAAVVKGNLQWENKRSIVVNMWPIETVAYVYPFYDKYNAGGEKGLIDGLLGSERFSDKKWQGWNNGNLDVRLDLGEAIPVGALHLNYLRDHSNWICSPVQIEIYGSKKGKRYKKIKEMAIAAAPFTASAKVERLRIEVGTDKYQFLRVVAVRPTSLPTDHPSFGGNPFMFIDELMVERGEVR